MIIVSQLAANPRLQQQFRSLDWPWQLRLAERWEQQECPPGKAQGFRNRVMGLTLAGE
jgi:hypothetical protein